MKTAVNVCSEILGMPVSLTVMGSKEIHFSVNMLV